jgi:hypothetical protein
MPPISTRTVKPPAVQLLPVGGAAAVACAVTVKACWPTWEYRVVPNRDALGSSSIEGGTLVDRDLVSIAQKVRMAFAGICKGAFGCSLDAKR